MRIICLDVGEKRIGVAKADSNTRIAVPVGFVTVDGSEWQQLARIANLNNTSFFVLGLPRSNEGNETAQSLYVRNFAKTLIEKIPGARIRFQDESLTSVIAEERLKKRGKKYEKGEIDTEAATVILQDFLENFSSPSYGTKRENLGLSTKNNNSSENSNLSVRKRAIQKVNELAQTVSETKAGQELSNVKGVAQKEANKVKLNTKKARHKMKTVTKWISGVSILIIVALLTAGGILIYKDIKAKERAEEYARIEAEMKAEVFNFTILPGQTIFDVKTNLKEAGYQDEEIEEAFKADYNFDFLKNRPEGATLEGYLFGETHEFYKSDTVKDVITRFLEGTNQIISENDLKNKYEKQGLSLYEGITLASMVQKEAPTAEMPTVAQVFLSRLKSNIPLGSDVTVSYALDVIDPSRKVYSDNQSALEVESCYNTRKYAGLPCGPIANPGISALQAVANPSDTSYFYFLTGDDGIMYYSYTESEHNQNIYSHCQDLCNVSL